MNRTVVIPKRPQLPEVRASNPSSDVRASNVREIRSMPGDVSENPHHPSFSHVRVSEPPREDVATVLSGSSRYRLVRCIARGGMGSVYLGVLRGAAGFERPVAIKKTHSHLLEDPNVRQWILQEARNGSAVRHPNVVSVNDVEEVDGELLLVMDYVEGGSLSQMIAAGKRLPVGVSISVILDACAGLSAIHSARDKYGKLLGLVHRDVSPQNILVGVDGAARIADFGISKSAGDPKRTAKSVRRGKFGYMAPEYLVTSVSSASSDIFGLGAVLWEVLAGRRLFVGESNAESIRLAAVADVPSLCRANDHVTPEVEAVVRRALARDPAHRFPSMAEFGQQLERAANGDLATRSEVSQWVAMLTGARSSVATKAPVETVSVRDAELAESSLVRSIPPSNAAAQVRGAFASHDDARFADLRSSDGAAPMVPTSRSSETTPSKEPHVRSNQTLPIAVAGFENEASRRHRAFVDGARASRTLPLPRFRGGQSNRAALGQRSLLLRSRRAKIVGGAAALVLLVATSTALVHTVLGQAPSSPVAHEP